ncbi:MAG TPA: prepilin-type N-terminal cleavage/methylation domain-containing protein [Candidatus Pacearchaeota archaeon]|nr:prepilin-type N-terminal cleavage/methylation domain-containing protein [Candidatus Pacearchaeota archaeon]HQD89375.1 prepilin-type N-terminal cleavage/methylation domain-containing protein [Candidatus Pacearchaeota archaeon]
MAKNKNKGFTLIELLVVIAIIAILAAVIMATTTGAQVQARDSRRVSDLDSLRTALELYNNKYGYYPKSGTGINPNQENFLDGVGQVLINEGLMAATPQDPKNEGDYKYKYCVSADGSKYALKANLEMKDNKALQSDYDSDWPTTNVCDCDRSETGTAPYTYCLRNP